MNRHTIPGVTMYEHTLLVGVDNIQFGRNIIIDDFVFIYAKNKIVFGNYVHIGCFTSIVAGGEITLGDFCSISHGCRIFSRQDDFKDCGFGNPTMPEKFRNIREAHVTIGKFAIIGANSVVLPGVEIGEGVAVGACSVVTRDLDPWGVYIGNRRIRERNKRGVLENYERYLREGGAATSAAQGL